MILVAKIMMTLAVASAASRFFKNPGGHSLSPCLMLKERQTAEEMNGKIRSLHVVCP